MRSRRWFLPFLILLSSVTVSASYQFYHLLAQREAAVTVSPATVTIENGERYKFSGSGGSAPYSYSLIGTGGSVDPSTGVFAADAIGGYTVTIRVTDSSGNFADATVTVPAAPVLNCDPSGESTTSLNGRFYDSGGAAGNYANDEYCSLEISNYPGTTLNFHFNSFDTEFNDKLTIYDSSWTGTEIAGNFAPSDMSTSDGYYYTEFQSDSATVAAGFDVSWTSTVSSTPILIGPASLNASFSSLLNVGGGVGPYVFSIVSGGGSLTGVNPKYVTYTAPNVSSTVTVRVTDGIGQTSDVMIAVTKDPLTLTSIGNSHGPASGGKNAAIYGTGFLQGMTVTFGGLPCTLSDNYGSSVNCSPPAHASGKVDVVATNPGGETFTLVGAYEYDTGTWTAMATPSTASRSYHASIWTGDRFIVWSGQDPTCAYANCVKSDGYVYNPLTDSWSAMAAAPIGGRIDAANIWTGEEALIFGGRSGGVLSDGARYNPYTNTWSSMPTPAWVARQWFSQVWTGKELILFGGQAGGAHATGWAYSPAKNSWRQIANGVGRYHHQAVWTGSKMFVYGGVNATSSYVQDGAIYDPETDTWGTVSTSNLFPKWNSTYNSHNLNSTFMIWTGSKVFLSGGGYDGTGSKFDGFYDPSTDSWSYTDKIVGSPPYSGMVWTGKHAVRVSTQPFFLDPLNSAYDPALDEFTYIADPIQKYQTRSLVWTGQDIITCFGYWYGATNADCERLDLEGLDHRLANMATDTWTSVSTTSAPTGRTGATSIWTGTHMIVWGGSDGTNLLNTGAKYDPINDTWTPISMTGAPSARMGHTAIWTGSSMIVWGGQDALSSPTYTATGAIYNPYTDSWTSLPTTAAPSARKDHTAVWTGSQMIVWGGYDGASLRSGGVYHILTNTWSSITVTASPATGIRRHGAVWTGKKMFIWGGENGGGFYHWGSLYDPVTDTWTYVTNTNAPDGRADFVTAYANGKVYIWGGTDGMAPYNTGSIYDINSDTWSPMSTTGAPLDRSEVSTAVAGQSIIVWGGKNGSTNYDDGYLYDMRNDTWTPLASSGLSARFGALVGWMGSIGDGHANSAVAYRNNTNGDNNRLIIWGGTDGTTKKTDGKIYRLPNM